MLLHALDHLVEADDLEPGEDARPDPVEDELENAEVEGVEPRGHLLHVAARLGDDLAPRDPALVRDAPGELRELGIAQDDVAHLARRAERRALHDPLLAVHVDLQHAREPAREAVLGLARRLGDDVGERDLAAGHELRLPAVPHVRDEPPHLARRVLHAVEQRRDARLASPVAGAAPHDRERHEEDRPLARRVRAHDLAQEPRPEARLGERAAPPPEDGLVPEEDHHRRAASDDRAADRGPATAGVPHRRVAAEQAFSCFRDPQSAENDSGTPRTVPALLCPKLEHRPS